MTVFAIDPGSEQSAWVLWDGAKLLSSGIIPNEDMLTRLAAFAATDTRAQFACERIASYGMAVGNEVFDTCFWSGRFAMGRRQVPDERGDARMAGVAHRRYAAGAHQPDQQQARDLIGPGKRLAEHLAAKDLKAHHGRLRDDEERDRPIERAIRRHARIAASQGSTPSARASAAQSRSAAG